MGYFPGSLKYDAKHLAMVPKTEICLKYFMDKDFQKLPLQHC
jgi:hypothetical protein